MKTISYHTVDTKIHTCVSLIRIFRDKRIHNGKSLHFLEILLATILHSFKKCKTLCPNVIVVQRAAFSGTPE